MSLFNENIDPRSLHNLSNLDSQPNGKQKLPKAPSARSGLTNTFLHNVIMEPPTALVDTVATQLPTPSASQAKQDLRVDLDRPPEEIKLPISPPPEEELRIQELITYGPFKEPQSRLPVRTRSTRTRTAPSTRNNTVSGPNPRKRPRSIAPSHYHLTSLTASPTISDHVAQPSIIFPSPNPRFRKQPKRKELNENFDARHKQHHEGLRLSRTLDNPNDGPLISPLRPSSPALKNRQDHKFTHDSPQYRRVSSTSSRDLPTEYKTRRRKSATPSVAYEPPSEQFTPPRNVVLRKPSSVPASRRSLKPSSTNVFSSVNKKVVRVKLEPLTSPFPRPPLDIFRPAPPPSPTDDPLLLVDPVSAHDIALAPSRIDNENLINTSVEADEDMTHLFQRQPSIPIGATRPMADQSLYNFQPDDINETALVDVEFDGPSQPSPVFGLDDSEDGPAYDDSAFKCALPIADTIPSRSDHSTSAGIFHSDDDPGEAGEDEGEYTGKYKFYSVPVRQDPPSSATRVRKENWGRPISPFPFARNRSKGSSPEGPTLSRRMLPCEDSPASSPSIGRRKSAESGQAPAVRMFAHSMASSGTTESSPGLCELIENNDPCDATRCQGFETNISNEHTTGIVEVSSANPKAAARAAAILKLHHSYVIDEIPNHVKTSPTVPACDTEKGRTWTKADWRELDTCFTDERLAVGKAMGLDARMAEVDDVEMDAVVRRFLAKTEDTKGWDCNLLLRRVTALSVRQRAGQGAPPSKLVSAPTFGKSVKEMIHSNHIDPPSVIKTRTASRTNQFLERARKESTSTPKELALAPTFGKSAKEMVHLNHIDPPSVAKTRTASRTNQFLERARKESTDNAKELVLTPTFKKSAKEMVQLNHIDPPSVAKPRTARATNDFLERARKESTGSVKDLVKIFEEVHKKKGEGTTQRTDKASLRKVASVGKLCSKPIWRP